MKITPRTSLFVITLMFTTATMAYADIARPKPSPTRESKYVTNAGMEIVTDAKAYNARLEISQATLNDLREAMAAQTTSQSFTHRIANGSTNTIIAGLFLCLSVSFAGVWLARNSNKGTGHKAAAALLLGVAIVGAAAIVTRANAGPPPGWAWRNVARNLNDGRPTTGSIDIEISPNGRGIRLVLPLKSGKNADD
jgi:hypothetical protein